MISLSKMNLIEFSTWLKEELQRQNITQAELVRRSGVSSAQISRIINMSSPAGQDALISIARALNHPPETLFRVAGLLPPVLERDEQTDALVHLFRQLSEDGRDEIMSVVELKVRRQRARSQIADLEARIGQEQPKNREDAITLVLDWLVEIGVKVRRVK